MVTTDSEQNSDQPVGTSCNAVTLALLVATLGFGTLGYQLSLSLGATYSVVGAVGGVAAGVLVTPCVFLALMLVIHVGIKIQDWFQPPKS